MQAFNGAVTYLRLDGSVPAHARQDIVTKFNSDPSIDVVRWRPGVRTERAKCLCRTYWMHNLPCTSLYQLLLTTHIGGLGLNLTGADTVIFVEHDWNPSRDLQAMDRAHRLGQRRVVTVYRLITRGTLEEKIMRYVSRWANKVSDSATKLTWRRLCRILAVTL